jgi:hypothetical protein
MYEYIQAYIYIYILINAWLAITKSCVHADIHTYIHIGHVTGYVPVTIRGEYMVMMSCAVMLRCYVPVQVTK